MTDEDWEASHARSLGAFLNGKAIQTPDDRGRSITDDSFLLLFNAHVEAVDWVIPPEYGKAWNLVLDTARLQPEANPLEVTGGITTSAGSVVVLQATESS
jgi:glycogen operon protein